MANLSKNNDVFTVMVEFDTEPETQKEVLAAIRSMAGVFPTQPGFVSEHFHRSHDGKRIVVYVQWRTEQDHLNCYNNPDLKPTGAGIMALVQAGKARMNVHTYEIVQSTELTRASA